MASLSRYHSRLASSKDVPWRRMYGPSSSKSFPLLSNHWPLTRYSAANLPADCLNLGQGYMNFAPPKWVTDAATEALSTVGANHYSHPKGRPRLRQAIKQFYGPQLNRDLDVESEILVTSGANEGMQYSVFPGPSAIDPP